MNERERVTSKINDLVDAKNSQLADISARLDELHAEMDAAETSMAAAASVLNEDAFASAEATLKKVKTKIEMYNSRSKQIAAQEYVSEEESEATIDSLLDYEKKLAAEFEKSITPHISALETILSNYIEEVQKTENTLNRWTSTIRVTYMNRTGRTRTVDGKCTNRFDTPQTIRIVPYIGCKASGALNTLLDTVKRSME